MSGWSLRLTRYGHDGWQWDLADPHGHVVVGRTSADGGGLWLMTPDAKGIHWSWALIDDKLRWPVGSRPAMRKALRAYYGLSKSAA